MQRCLTDLNIHHLRNIHSAKLQLHPHLNFIQGPNGSGKSSLLEAIYMLSSGHSFKTRETSPLVQVGESSLTVFARTMTDESISIQKSLAGPTIVKLNQQSCFNSSDLARFLPCQVVYQDIFQIIDAGPSVRRTLLDWGMFHVEPSYHAIWKDYRTVLKQRNALLRQNSPRSSFAPWDNQLVSLSVKLHSLREAYFSKLVSSFNKFLECLTNVYCSISYFKGWDKRQAGNDLSMILHDQFSADQQRQFTSCGAHQADIIFEIPTKKAKSFYSRGQQKIILVALKLAQASLLPNCCLYLFDDLAAELDEGHMDCLLTCLSNIPGQKFITSVDGKFLNNSCWDNQLSRFNVLDGKIFI